MNTNSIHADKPIRFGIIGTGRITRRFMADFPRAEGVSLRAVCSTAIEKAHAFSQLYQAPDQPAPLAFDRVEDLTSSGAVDIVYVATAHPFHWEAAEKCLRAGIPVLCEKPVTVNAAQLRRLIAVAKETRTFFMEAYWTRFFPLSIQVLDWVRAGEIGDIVLMNGSFTARAARQAGDRLWDPAQAGGALLDIGVYPVQYAMLLTGTKPDRIASLARIADGVDETDGILLSFPGGATAVLYTSLMADGPSGFTILGTRGRIDIPETFWRPRKAVLYNEKGETVAAPALEGEGFQYEIAHAAQCVRQGQTVSPLLPLEHTLRVMETCDALRTSWGLRYPCEDEGV